MVRLSQFGQLSRNENGSLDGDPGGSRELCCSSTASWWPAVAAPFATVNPATEEVLGVAADAGVEDMGRAIEAARRAFDETDWSTNAELRVRCLRQLQDALREHVEELRELTISEVGAPRMLTAGAQLEGPLDDLQFSADTAESYSWHTDLGVASPQGIPTRRTIAPRGRRRRRRDHAVEFPAPDQPRQARTRAGGGQHRGAQAGAGHAVVCGRASARSSPSTPISRRAWSTSSPPATTASARCCRKTHGWTWSRSPGRRRPAAA